MGAINQRNKKYESLYFQLGDALAGLNLQYKITPHSATPVLYEIQVKELFVYRGDYKQCEAFISGLMTGLDYIRRG